MSPVTELTVASRVSRKVMRFREYLTLPNLSLAFMLVCCLLIGAFEEYTSYFSLALLGVILLNWNKDEFYLFSSVFLLFGEQFYLVAGSTPLYRVYTYLVLIRFLFDIGKIRFRPQFLPTVAVFVSFCLLAACPMSMRIGLQELVDAVLCFIILTRLRQSVAMMRKLAVVFTLAAVCAGVYSLLAETVVSYETGVGAAMVEIVRYYGTLGDANYAGCFYNVAIFMALCSHSLRRWYLRWPLVAILVYFLLLTSSQTALLCLGACFCLYIVLRWRMKGIPFLMGFLALTAVFFYIMITVPNPEAMGPLATLSTRLKTSFADAVSGDVEDLTTNRSALWKIAWDYYIRQPLVKQLLGGNVVTMLLSEQYWLDAVGAVHQSYIQGLLNFGLIGTVIIFGARIMQTIGDAIVCLNRNESQMPTDVNMCAVMVSLIFLLYALTIDIFIDWRALFLYFI